MPKIYLTIGTSWAGVVTDGSDITVECIGGGGAGLTATTKPVISAGGGGAYARKVVPYTSGAAVTGIQIGQGGASSGAAGTDTIWDTNVVIAKCGGGAAAGVGGAGGAAASCTPTTGAFSGGAGGSVAAPTERHGAGGGGAAGPRGNGKEGGSGGADSVPGGGGGGGGAGGGSSTLGENSTEVYPTGDGGTAQNGTAGAAGVSTNGASGLPGSQGSGGSGGAGHTGLASVGGPGGAGGAGLEFDATHGAGGGGAGGGGSNNFAGVGGAGGAGGLYGGGGGGGAFSATAGDFGAGANGLIVITYHVAGFVIDDVSRDILQNWQITEQLNERGTMRFGVKSMDATYRPGLREVIDFRKFGIHFFAGHIHHTDEAGLGGYGVVPIVTQCGATDFKALTDRRKGLTMTLAAGTLKSQFLELAELLEIYGTTVDPDQVNGPSMPEMVLQKDTLTSAFQKLSVASGYALVVSYDNVVSMVEPGSEAAPFNIEDNDARVKGDVRVSPTTVEYGNYITVRYTQAGSAAYAFFTLTDVPSEDETVTVGSIVYTWKASPAGGNEVQIGGSVAASIDNLIGAIFPAHPEVVASEQASDTVRVTAKEPGVSGNGIQVATTCADGSWFTEGGGLVSHLNLGADAALTGLAIAQDIPAQDGGANLYEKEYEHPEVENDEAAQALADGYLVQSLVQPREVRYRTRLHGLHHGMQQQIQVTGRNVDGPCLITAVDISPEGSALINYDVTAVEGLVIVPSHQDAWRKIEGGAVK